MTAPIYTRPRYLAAVWLDGCRLDRAIIGDGSDAVLLALGPNA